MQFDNTVLYSDIFDGIDKFDFHRVNYSSNYAGTD